MHFLFRSQPIRIVDTLDDVFLKQPDDIKCLFIPVNYRLPIKCLCFVLRALRRKNHSADARRISWIWILCETNIERKLQLLRIDRSTATHNFAQFTRESNQTDVCSFSFHSTPLLRGLRIIGNSFSTFFVIFAFPNFTLFVCLRTHFDSNFTHLQTSHKHVKYTNTFWSIFDCSLH